MSKISLLSATTLAAGTMLLAAAGVAQTPATTGSAVANQGEAIDKSKAGFIEAANADADGGGESTIIVTGSRIATPNDTSPIPISSISGEQLLTGQGGVSIGDRLNDLPGIRSTYSQQNSTRFLGTHGLNLVDLRGLGPQRTLVLVNGRRHVASDILSNGVSVDINTIPESLIDRVDVVTGGDSAVYGSDAIAGVVNFVLKDHYEGIEANARSGISTYGDAASRLATVLAGRNFADGRGNIAVDAEYTHQSAFYGSNRPGIRRQDAFVVVDTDPAGSLNGSDGVPDRVFLRDVRSTTISNGGLVSFTSPTGACGRDVNSGAAFACKYLFQPDGSLVPETGQRVGVAPNGNFLGGNGSNLRESNILVLQPKQDRYVASALGHFEVSPAVVPFFESEYSRIDTTGSQSGPAFVQGTTLSAFGYNTTYERPALSNPYLSAQARALITQQLIASGTVASSITDATRFSLSRNLLDLGVRNERDRREVFRIVGGVRGDLGDGWHYEASGNYGRFRERTVVEGNINIQRFLLSMDSTRNAAGQIVCRSQVTASTAQLALNPNNPDQTILANDVAACVPVNPFGEGNISNAAKNYILQNTVSHGRISQLVGNAYITGDSSKWFSLPGGPVGVSVGGEYRRETNFYGEDPLIRNGYTFYNAISTLSAPAFEVKEAFGEVRVPILRDRPFFRELTLTGSGRVSDYKGSTGTVYTYSGAAVYAPVRDIRFRGNYSRSVRAPNIGELYSTQSANFATVVDPCSARNIATGTTMRAANCAAAGIPASYDYVYTQSLAIRSGGNPNLTAEKSDSHTFGVDITPHWIPGLSVTVDYYSITVKNVITSVTAQNILNSCYDLTTGNPFCSLFQRAGAGGGPNGEQQFRIVENSLLQSTLNFAKLKVRGIDFDVTYRHSFDNIGTVSVHGVYTHALQRDQFVSPSDPGRADRILGELGDPIDAFNIDTSLKHGKVTFGYELRFLGHMVLNTWEDTHSVQDRAPENLDYADRQYYPNVWYHDVRVALDVNPKFNIYLGVDNLLDRLPPFGLTGVGAGSGIYDVRGRYIYTGIKVKI